MTFSLKFLLSLISKASKYEYLYFIEIYDNYLFELIFFGNYFSLETKQIAILKKVNDIISAFFISNIT